MASKRRKPCSTTSLRDGSMLAYFVAQDGKTVILDRLGSAGPGRALRRHQQDWLDNLILHVYYVAWR